MRDFENGKFHGSLPLVAFTIGLHWLKARKQNKIKGFGKLKNFFQQALFSQEKKIRSQALKCITQLMEEEDKELDTFLNVLIIHGI